MPSTSRSTFSQVCYSTLVERSWAAGLLLAALWLILFNQLQVEWSINPQYSYGWLMPFLGAYLLWRRWEDRPEAQPFADFKGLTVAAAPVAFLLLPGRLLQEANPDWRLVSWWLAFCVLTLTLLAVFRTGGLSWLRHFAFPFLFMLLSVPWPTGPEQAVIQHMMQSVTTVTVEALNWCGVFALQRGNLIELPGGVVGIDEACSGVRSLQSTLMAALFIGELSRLPWTKRLLLLASGLLLAFLLNCARAFILASFYSRGGSHALEEWHDPAGYAILLVSFGLLLLIAKKISGPESLPQPPPSPKPSPASFSIKLLAGFAFWLLVCELGTELWYRSHERSQQNRQDWSLSWPEKSESFQKRDISENVRTILRYNEGTNGIFRNADGTVWNVFELVWHPGRVSAQLAGSHSPEICLPAGGAQAVGEKTTESWNINGIPFQVQAYTFRQGTSLWQIFYISWESVHRETAQSPSDDFYAYGSKFRAVWNGQRNPGQKVIEIAATGYPDRESAQVSVKDYLTKSIKPK